ncbi:transposase [Myxococcus xanthus]|uniref:transposase n=1 Tax=Myxococcus xanthus TaxID=34 RepID=UPI00112E449C|nr:transposase [Myxococcus xanthus]
MHTFAAINVITGAVTNRLSGSRVGTRRKDGLSKTKRMQVAFAHHLLDIARAYPADEYPEVVIVIDNAPWHRGRPVDWALRRYPHLTLYRLPPYSPQLQPVERLWRPLCGRTTHNLLFDEMTELQDSLRSGLAYHRARPRAVLKLLGSLWNPTTSAEA